MLEQGEKPPPAKLPRGSSSMPLQRRRDIYAGRDVLEVPAYSLPEAAHYLRIPAATLRSWVIGRSYPTERGKKWARALVSMADRQVWRIARPLHHRDRDR